MDVDQNAAAHANDAQPAPAPAAADAGANALVKARSLTPEDMSGERKPSGNLEAANSGHLLGHDSNVSSGGSLVRRGSGGGKASGGGGRGKAAPTAEVQAWQGKCRSLRTQVRCMLAVLHWSAGSQVQSPHW